MPEQKITEATDPKRRSALEQEYNVVGSDWRFLSSIRFALLAFSITLNSFLLGAYQFTLTPEQVVTEQKQEVTEKKENTKKIAIEKKKEEILLAELKKTATKAIPIIGILFLFILTLIEWRTRNLYGNGCVERGKEIEDLLGLKGGHFHKLDTTPVPLRIGTTFFAVLAFYGIIMVV
ncbi:MAG: hypothetical protein A3C80_00600 [Candidatus Ryanbacteria bacterium RIFCSPHIGHO2_02_FULL_45_43]|uniref:Uncharacterized protein n=1 Tax=Candidatus Ryanbacteria bacterium RIFCSPHIGHO2_01_45_13 TaxID=1802112 RepID=A0A1G2FX98_9BACT|nr:MAG: hypothetical protein A2718_01990 [Candidatus Ryanbacteria bacterium RIFCSPHIGHO2_01_FULL_44_130]OGZ42699.1 MAG: hypothetical protein A2W41_03075 [Candidatus Ryanbacteria bacterium RIFCSPHIGHO2_01_45_13]OGZ48813.1 MAG: hypothetical protein A3C80_00600 [Candidatus Ryanbacteria bacterium RIFCSPHIGHO2_02_FULL_45_43]OGZ50845.1 MAG: hypothetical protein A3E55_02620 [Candidatus Ryanbacteria bacterium RIFCSPHIGHO2_12_FULL_44_20]OGZ52056.1 MAG: hypothetical protein A3A17_01205 [Candidatus Ryanba